MSGIQKDRRNTSEADDLALSVTLLRLTRGWKQDQLAEAAGIQNSALSEYEKGKKVPELKTLLKIVSALGYPLSAIDRIPAFLAELRAESLLEAQLAADGTHSLVPVDSAFPATAHHNLHARARRVAAQLGQAATASSLLLFDLLLRRRS